MRNINFDLKSNYNGFVVKLHNEKRMRERESEQARERNAKNKRASFCEWEKREKKKLIRYTHSKTRAEKKISSHNFKFTPVQIIANEQCGAAECPCNVK